MASTEPVATVTIHRGELAQIKRLITKSDPKKAARGQFFGLWTHSFQPVIQIVVGLPETKPKHSNQYFSNCQDIIEKHGLRLLGEWRGVVPTRGSAKLQLPSFQDNRYVNMSFKMEREKLIPVDCAVQRGGHREEQQGKLEILPGQSSFRLYKNLTKILGVDCDVGPVDVRTEDRAAAAETERGLVREAEVKEDQWYSTERGMEILRFLFQNLQIHFQVLETSRNTETHNIGFSLLYTAPRGEQSIRVEFPADFPKSAATLILDGNETPVHINEEESEQQPEELSQIICTKVLSLLEQPCDDKPGQDEARERTEHERVTSQAVAPGGAAEPDAAKPDAAELDAAKPDAAEPDAAKPDAATHDVDMSDAVTQDGSTKEQSDHTQGTADVVVSSHQMPKKESPTAEVQKMGKTSKKQSKTTNRGPGLTSVEVVELLPPAAESSTQCIDDTSEFTNGNGTNTTEKKPAASGSNTTEENPAGSGGNTTAESLAGDGSNTTEQGDTATPMDVDAPVDTPM